MLSSFKRPFAQYVKKAHKPLQLAIADAVDLVCEVPEIGELKVGDLAGIQVYKFRFNRQEYLLAYRAPRNELPILRIPRIARRRMLWVRLAKKQATLLALIQFIN